jgi:hypothetical protein
MKKSCLLILSSLCFAVSFPAHASLGGLEEVFPDSNPNASVEVTKTLPSVDASKLLHPLDFLQEKGFAVSNYEYMTLGATCSDYFIDDVQALLSELSDKGILDKCASASQVNDLLKTLLLLGKQGPFAQVMRMDIIKDLILSGVLFKCEDGAALNKVLVAFYKYGDMTCLSLLDWFSRSRAVAACAHSGDIIKLTRHMKKFRFKNTDDHTTVMTAMADIAAFKHCSNLKKVTQRFDLAKEMRRRDHIYIWPWLSETRVLGLCKTLDEETALFELLESIAAAQGNSILMRIESSEIFQLCEDIDQVNRFLNEMNALVNDEKSYALTGIGRDAYLEFQDMAQVFQFLEAYKAGNDEFRSRLCEWISVGIKPAKEKLIGTLRAIKSLDEGQRADFMYLCGDSQISGNVVSYDGKSRFIPFKFMEPASRDLILRHLPQITEDEEEEEKSQWSTSNSQKLAGTLQAYSVEERRQVMSLPFAPIKDEERRSWQSAKEVASVELQKKDLLEYFEKWDPELRAHIIAWLAEAAADEQRISFYHNTGLRILFDDLRGLASLTISKPDEKGTFEWLKGTRFFERDTNPNGLRSIVTVLKDFHNYSLSELIRICKGLSSRSLIDVDFVKLLFVHRYQKNPLTDYADSLRNTDKPLYVGKADMTAFDRETLDVFYLFLLSIGYQDKRILDYFEKQLAFEPGVVKVRELIVRELSRHHPVTKQLLVLGIQPDSSLKVLVNSLANRIYLSQLDENESVKK